MYPALNLRDEFRSDRATDFRATGGTNQTRMMRKAFPGRFGTADHGANLATVTTLWRFNYGKLADRTLPLSRRKLRDWILALGVFAASNPLSPPSSSSSASSTRLRGTIRIYDDHSKRKDRG